jgi:hypothetical protein
VDKAEADEENIAAGVLRDTDAVRARATHDDDKRRRKRRTNREGAQSVVLGGASLAGSGALP